METLVTCPECKGFRIKKQTFWDLLLGRYRRCGVCCGHGSIPRALPPPPPPRSPFAYQSPLVKHLEDRVNQLELRVQELEVNANQHTGFSPMIGSSWEIHNQDIPADMLAVHKRYEELQGGSFEDAKQ